MAQKDEYQMGATFFPGLDDYYYMPPGTPDVISPAPQRFTPEVPAQMQDSLAALELDSTEIRKEQPSASESQQPYKPLFDNSQRASTNTGQELAPQAVNTSPLTPNEPNFSFFPKLATRTSNVPPTIEEREITLEAARASVLRATDPEMQLYWAEDALAFVDNCIGYERHIAPSEGARPNTPSVERQIRVDAVNVVNFLAEQGHPKAEFMRGMWLEFGKFGHAQNKPEAFRAYKRAAAKGYARAEYRMGLQYESTAEPMKALQHYKAGESLGDSASCYRIGMMCLLGQLGQAQDFATGVRLVKYAADTADENAPQGAYVFGMLQGGELAQVKIPENLLPIDQSIAKGYIEKAAFMGFAKAQEKMGAAYELCSLGCQFDPTLSMHYMGLAVRQGEPGAEMAISKWFLCGYEGLFQKNNELAYKYALRATKARLDTAEFALGYFNEVGIYVPIDINRARDWYEKAAKNGNEDAQSRLIALGTSQTLKKSDHEGMVLSRIRSQYGSKRGSRPERFTNPVNTMPSITDQVSRYSTPQISQQDRRTPYPIDDRPATTAPYPTEFAPQTRPLGPPNPAFVVSSQRPPPAAAYGKLPAARPVLGLPPRGQLPRPGVASVGPAGRPGPVPYDRRQPSASSFHADARYESRPTDGANSLRRTSGPGPAILPSGRPNMDGRDSFASATAPPKSSMDIGFSAPIDTRADQLNRPVGTPRPSRMDAGRPYSTQATYPQTGSPKPLNANGPRLSSRPPVPNGALQEAPRPPPSAPTPKPSTVPPGKGPKTFEEMGVPKAKQDQDCVVM